MLKCFHVWMLMMFVVLFLVGCTGAQSVRPPINTFTPPAPSPILTQTPPPPTASSIPTVIPSQTTTPEPTGCLIPPDDYTRVDVNGWTINQRTLSMLAHAQEL